MVFDFSISTSGYFLALTQLYATTHIDRLPLYLVVGLSVSSD